MLEIGLTQLVNSFVLPPGGIVVLMLLAALLYWRSRKGGRLLLVLAGSLLLLLSLPVVANRLMNLLEPYPVVSPEAIAQFQPQAIVILAGGRWDYAPEYGGSSVNQLTLQRLLYGVKLYRQTGLPLLVSGGNEKRGLPAEARLMAQVLEEQFAIQPRWVEMQSRTTGENAQFSQRILAEEKIQRVLLVTHAWHMPRAVPVFERQGLEILPAPTGFDGQYLPLKFIDFLPHAWALKQSYDALHEFIGAGWYALRY